MKVSSSRESRVVDRDTLVKMQFDDDSLKSYRDREGSMVKGKKEVFFEVRKEYFNAF